MQVTLRWSEAKLKEYLAKRGLKEEGAVPKRNALRVPAGPTPQQILEAATQTRWPGRFEPEAKDLVPGRRYRADLCDRELRAIVELDGFANHGRTKAGFYRDRERDFHLLINDWHVLRIPAGLVRSDLATALGRIQQFIAFLERQRAAHTAKQPRVAKSHTTRRRTHRRPAGALHA